MLQADRVTTKNKVFYTWYIIMSLRIIFKIYSVIFLYKFERERVLLSLQIKINNYLLLMLYKYSNLLLLHFVKYHKFCFIN